MKPLNNSKLKGKLTSRNGLHPKSTKEDMVN
jgi:hypothetical protein